ncbi:hypothetical protein D9M68_448700 [compost metagenome]
MTPADLHAGGVGGNQREADAEVFFVAQQVFRVVGLEGEAEQRGHRAEGDVALLPGQAQADDFLALPLAPADDAYIRHGAGVRPGQRTGQGEAGDVLAARQARQVTLALQVGAVVQQQFGRAQGVGHHHGGSEVATAGRQLHRHLGMGIGGEALAAIFLRDDQGEEAVLPDVCPGPGWQVQLLADLPVTDHGAELLGRAVEERLFFFRQLRAGRIQQLAPVRPAAEQLAVPPDGAGLDGLALGLRHGRQHPLEPGEQGRAEPAAAPFRQCQGQGSGEPAQPEQEQQPALSVTEEPHQQQEAGHQTQGGGWCGAAVGETGDAQDQGEQPEEQHGRSSLTVAGASRA